MTMATLGQTEQGMRLVRRAIAFAPRVGPLRTNLGWLLLQAGRLEEALTSLERYPIRQLRLIGSSAFFIKTLEQDRFRLLA